MNTMTSAALTGHQKAARKLGWIGAGAVAAGTAVFTAWALTAPLASTAVAEGVFKTDLSRRVVQHQEGGIIRELRVRDGDRVRAGQVLVVLDDPNVRAQYRVVRSMLDSEIAKLARLEAERSLSDHLVLPAQSGAGNDDANAREIAQREHRVFTDRRNALNAQLALIAEQRAEVRREITALEANTQASADASAQMQQELKNNEKLLADGYVAANRVVGLRRAYSEYQMKESGARAEIAKARQKLLDLDMKARALKNDFAQTANNELKQTSDRVEQLRAQLEPNADAARRQQITAPVSGRVVGMRVNTIGAVLPPRETILEIVPEDTRILVEGRLRTDAIDQVAPGGKAGVRLSAYDQRTVSLVEGKVTYISADRQTDRDSGQAYYTVHVEIPDTAFAAAKVSHPIPGMPAELYFRSGERTAVAFLMDPILHRLRLAMQE